MTEVRTLLTGRGLVESPRWNDDRLYFSDWSAGEVLGVDLDGRREVVARVESLPLCTACLPDGRLVIVSSAQGSCCAASPRGPFTYAELGQPGWNDIVIDGRGNAYVNRCGFDPVAGSSSRPAPCIWSRRTACPGRWPGTSRFPTGWRSRRTTPGWSSRTPTGTTRGVRHRRRRRAVAHAGCGPNSATASPTASVSTRNQQDVLVRRCAEPAAGCGCAEGGTVLRTINLDRGGFACVLGGPDGVTLFVTAAEWRGMGEASPVRTGKRPCAGLRRGRPGGRVAVSPGLPGALLQPSS